MGEESQRMSNYVTRARELYESLPDNGVGSFDRDIAAGFGSKVCRVLDLYQPGLSSKIARYTSLRSEQPENGNPAVKPDDPKGGNFQQFLTGQTAPICEQDSEA